MKTVNVLLDEYKHFLNSNHPENSNSFHQRCNSQPEAARAEAVVFSFFKQNGYDIRVEETRSEGGVDFRVQTANTEFVTEVASIKKEAFTRRSGAPERPIRGYYTDLYRVAQKTREVAYNKTEQMSGYNCPTILIITCEHPEYGYLLRSKDEFGPPMFIASPPIYDISTRKNVTRLEYSLFFRFNERNRVVFCRTQISAVLFFYIDEKHGAEIVGLLHPKPTYKFSRELLSSVPFVKALVPERVLTSEMEDYSVEDFDNRIRTRWILGNPPNGLFRYN